LGLQVLHNKSNIHSFLKKSAELQIYLIGDLDDFYWRKTTWYGFVEKNKILSVALLYSGMEMPTLLSFYDKNPDYSYKLLVSIKPILPERFYAHLSPGLTSAFGTENIMENYGLHYKMVLRKIPSDINDPCIRRLSSADLQIIQDFYSIAYPHNWFDRRMLATKKYFGYFRDGKLAGISGIHVYSKKYNVAALGNIATHPDFRGQQIGFKLTSKLCFNLSEKISLIGLNVRSDNEFALKCYHKTGFEIVGEYEECLIKNPFSKLSF